MRPETTIKTRRRERKRKRKKEKAEERESRKRASERESEKEKSRIRETTTRRRSIIYAASLKWQKRRGSKKEDHNISVSLAENNERA